MFPFQSKTEVQDVIVTNLKHYPPAVLHFDHGTEFKNERVLQFCIDTGIKTEFTPVNLIQFNGTSERG